MIFRHPWRWTPFPPAHPSGAVMMNLYPLPPPPLHHLNWRIFEDQLQRLRKSSSTSILLSTSSLYLCPNPSLYPSLSTSPSRPFLYLSLSPSLWLWLYPPPSIPPCTHLLCPYFIHLPLSPPLNPSSSALYPSLNPNLSLSVPPSHSLCCFPVTSLDPSPFPPAISVNCKDPSGSASNSSPRFGFSCLKQLLPKAAICYERRNSQRK
jgi:hypothetical protein